MRFILIFTLLTCSTILAQSNCSPPEPDGFFIRGDVNNDGVVNNADVSYLFNYLYQSGPEPCEWSAADVNDDGTVDHSDPVYLNNYLFQGGPAPFDPFPTAGHDCTIGDSICRLEPTGFSRTLNATLAQITTGSCDGGLQWDFKTPTIGTGTNTGRITLFNEVRCDHPTACNEVTFVFDVSDNHFTTHQALLHHVMGIHMDLTLMIWKVEPKTVSATNEICTCEWSDCEMIIVSAESLEVEYVFNSVFGTTSLSWTDDQAGEEFDNLVHRWNTHPTSQQGQGGCKLNICESDFLERNQFCSFAALTPLVGDQDPCELLHMTQVKIKVPVSYLPFLGDVDS